MEWYSEPFSEKSRLFFCLPPLLQVIIQTFFGYSPRFKKLCVCAHAYILPHFLDKWQFVKYTFLSLNIVSK